MQGLLSCNLGVDLKAKSFIPAHTSPLKCPVLLLISSAVAAQGQAGLWQEGKGAGMGAELGMDVAAGAGGGRWPQQHPGTGSCRGSSGDSQNSWCDTTGWTSAAPGTSTALWDGGERKRHGEKMGKETEKRWKRSEEEMENGVEKRKKGMEERWERG